MLWSGDIITRTSIQNAACSVVVRGRREEVKGRAHLLRGVGQKQGCEEVDPLKVARLRIQRRVRDQHVPQRLAPARSGGKQLHAREGAVQVAVDDAARLDLIRRVRVRARGFD